MFNTGFWKGRKVFITGHTGFKGSWLSIWLHSMGAVVTGYSLRPPTDPSLFELCGLEGLTNSIIADVRDLRLLKDALASAGPEVVIHMAAQSLVRDSYANPLETYSVNVMGTLNLFEAVRECKGVRAVINVTTDKCYENRELARGYREDDTLGGYDPYSSSKACSELVTTAYRNSFFNVRDYEEHGVAFASARAGNVIGGGDWAADRLVPDFIRALSKNEPVVIRNPGAVRPWQHVLEPLSGYLMLAERLVSDGAAYAGGWNFGPDDGDARSVEWLVERLCSMWGEDASYTTDEADHPHETNYLKLNSEKARTRLGWRPRWKIEEALFRVMEWTEAWRKGGDLREVCLGQIESYLNETAGV